MLRIADSGPPITDKIVDQFERRHGIRLPTAYRSFLLVQNGGRPERDLITVPGCKASPFARIHFFHGIGGPLGFDCYDLDWNIKICADLYSKGLLPIASTEGSDMICMALRSGEIVFWDGYEQVPVYPLAPNFEKFIGALYRDELSPHFDPLPG
jgi:hypothetical protein